MILTVRRTGGFIGRTVTGALDLAGDDPRVGEASALLARLDLASAPTGRPHPDMYTYLFEVSGSDGQVQGSATVPEHLLSPDLRALAHLVLSPGR